MSKKPSVGNQNSRSDDLKRQARKKQPGLAAEFVDFILHNKKWWLIPIVVLLLLVGLLIVLSGTGAAPFIYTLF
jgi:hypothetical protein